MTWLWGINSKNRLLASSLFPAGVHGSVFLGFEFLCLDLYQVLNAHRTPKLTDVLWIFEALGIFKIKMRNRLEVRKMYG